MSFGHTGWHTRTAAHQRQRRRAGHSLGSPSLSRCKAAERQRSSHGAETARLGPSCSHRQHRPRVCRRQLHSDRVHTVACSRWPLPRRCARRARRTRRTRRTGCKWKVMWPVLTLLGRYGHCYCDCARSRSRRGAPHAHPMQDFMLKGVPAGSTSCSSDSSRLDFLFF
jgi:hypothetical protein